MWEAVHFTLKQYNKNHARRVSTYQELKEILVRTDPIRQFLLQTGITLFKGMEFDELIRLHVDIQYIPSGKKKRPGKTSEEHLVVIAMTTGDGKEYVFSAVKHDERTLLEQSLQCINKIDPDIIEGYDLFGAILPALMRGCNRHGLSCALGRDGSDMRTPGSHGTLGFGESEWFSYDVIGRHLVDTLTIADGEMDSKSGDHALNLFSIARHFDLPLVKEDAHPLHRIVDVWDLEPKKVIEYSLRCAHLVCELSNLLSPPLFYLTQMCPLTYKMITQLGATSRIESLLLREYVRQKYSIPRPAEGSRNINVPSEIYHVGVFSNVIYITLEGLYSSIILRQGIRPKSDILNVFLPLLSSISFLQQTLEDPIAGNPLQQRNMKALRKALRFLLDSFHQYLGSAKGLYNDPDQAEVILRASREILREIEHQIELHNATIIQSDGQGFFLLTPDNIVGEANQQNFTERLSSTLPEGIRLVLSHRYLEMLSYRKGNYAVLDQNNHLLIKGNGLISRGMERYLRVFIQRFIECLLTKDFKRLHHAYASAYTQVMHHKWSPLDFCRTEIARMDTETYLKDITAGRIDTNPVMNAVVRSSLYIKANARISYYFTGTEIDSQPSDSSRLAEEWDPLLPDENTAYYLARLHETAQKFKEFLEPTAYERILSLDEMFGFSDEGIRLLARKVTPEALETKTDVEEFGIWLSETE
jgi:DNA polymerase I